MTIAARTADQARVIQQRHLNAGRVAVIVRTIDGLAVLVATAR